MSMQERSVPDSAGVVRRDARSTGERSVLASLLRGARLTCPACGEALHHHRADDAPPYFTIVIVGHIVVGLVLAVEMAYRPPIWVHEAIWLPLTVLLALLLLPVIKGALVGLPWALLMHGFDPNAEDEKIESFDAGVRNGPAC